MTPAHSSKTTRSSHSAQYFVDARHTVMPCRILFSTELFPIGIVCLLLWQISGGSSEPALLITRGVQYVMKTHS